MNRTRSERKEGRTGPTKLCLPSLGFIIRVETMALILHLFYVWTVVGTVYVKAKEIRKESTVFFKIWNPAKIMCCVRASNV
jgi:hypothetical protein